jgi:hypothetical protein
MTYLSKTTKKMTLTCSFFLYVPVFTALVGGKVVLYRPLQALAGRKVTPAGGKIKYCTNPGGAAKSDKVVLAVCEVLYANFSPNLRPQNSGKSKKSSKQTKLTFSVSGKTQSTLNFVLSPYLMSIITFE